MTKLPKRTINISIILITFAFAVYYFNKHLSLLKSIAHINLLTAVVVLVLYLLMLLVIVAVFSATINLASFKLKFVENILLNSYSVFINFFVPGQSGVFYRAYYLKRNHKFRVSDFTIATLIYYLIYGLLAVEFLVVGSQAWWISILSLIFFILLAVFGSKFYVTKIKHERIKLHLSRLGWLILATIIQALLQLVIYWVELHSVNHQIRLNQVITYTGAANLAMFVALTPAAIGIRESFLIFSEKLHHVSTANIVLANVIDRSVFIVFLLIVGLSVLVFKTKKRLTKLSFQPD